MNNWIPVIVILAVLAGGGYYAYRKIKRKVEDVSQALFLNCTRLKSGKSLWICGSKIRVIPDTDFGVAASSSACLFHPSTNESVPNKAWEYAGFRFAGN